MWWLPAQADPVAPVIDKTGLPGGDAAAKLIGGLMYLGLLACIGAVVIGATMWAWGSHSGNYRGSYAGRCVVIGGAVGALLIGAAVTIVNFAFSAGQTVT